MPVILDTGPLIAAMNPRDPHRDRGRDLLRAAMGGKHGKVLVPDAIVTEALTFLQRRVHDLETSKVLRDLLASLPVLTTDAHMLERAIDRHFTQWARRLSVPDCILLEHAQSIGATVATLESAWDGLAPILQP